MSLPGPSRTSLLAAGALVAALLLAPPARAGAQDEVFAAEPDRPEWGRGPIEVRDPYLLALPRLAPWVRSPELLASGQVELELRGTWANSYTVDPGRFVIDGEVRQVTASVRVGVLDRIELGLDLPWEWRGGGVMDTSIERFHDRFGLGQQFRSLRPRGRYAVAGVQTDGAPFDLDGKGEGFMDLMPEARVLLLRGGEWWPALSATLLLRLPTGDPGLTTSHGVDGSLGLDASKRLGPVVLYASVAWTSYAHARIEGLELARYRLLVGAGLEVELGRRASFVAHVWSESRRETRLHGPASLVQLSVDYLVCGVKLEPVDGLLLELGVLENVVAQETSADFGLMASVSYRF